MKKIFVLGSTNTDMVIADRKLPAPGETISGGRFMMNPGGKGANQAVAVARLAAKRGACVFVAFQIIRKVLLMKIITMII